MMEEVMFKYELWGANEGLWEGLRSFPRSCEYEIHRCE
jgi:hypothetical protein